MKTPISGLIAAAGRSTRMGHPKALLRFGDERAIGRLVRVFLEAGVHPIRVVVNAEIRAPVIEALAGLSPAESPNCPTTGAVRIIQNNLPGSGLSDSIRIALSECPLEGEDAVLLCPVDVPLVEPADIRELIRAFLEPTRSGADRSRETGHESQPAIVVPVLDGRRGHPALFRRDAAQELRDLGPDEPAHVVVRRDPTRVLEVAATNRELFVDLDDPQAYAAARARFEARGK